MKQHISRLIQSARTNAERGAVLFLVAITALIVMVAGAIAVDLSAIATRGQSLQNAADSAALAGVQAYRQSMGERTEANSSDEAAAIAAVNALLEQNGITDITPSIEFPDPTNDTEVRVTLYDGDAGFLLSGFTGGSTGTVERSATARFERCEDGCIKEVAIPPPFQAVNASGDGDGYLPLPVGDRLYAINHQSGLRNGSSQQITCVLRQERPRTDDPERTTQLCWDYNNGAPRPGMRAYPSNNVPAVTPEMPHAAVEGSKIYWASSTSNGHYMFCFETEIPAPCAQSLRLNSNRLGPTSGNGVDPREAHRGGGTVLEDGLLYTFTDDHKVNCVIPGVVMAICPGYPRESSVGQLGFPDNDPDQGSHGSSIDRIVDDASNRIYSTIHINAPTGPECGANQDNLRYPSGTVVLKNASSGLYIAMNSSHSGFTDGVDPEDPNAQWHVERNSSGGTYYYRFRNAGALEAGRSRYIAVDSSGGGVGRDLVYTTGSSSRRVWRVEHAGATSRVRTWYNYSGSRLDISEGTGSTGDIEFVTDYYTPVWSDWIIRPWECEVADSGPDVYNGVAYTTGTWLNCFDTNLGAPCTGFTGLKLHEDEDSFSGRLFFSRDAAGNATGVCSTGFSRQFDYTTGESYQSDTEVTCVDLLGDPAPTVESSLVAFRNQLATYNRADYNASENARWGTWGDPHYNEHSNRLFYPTHRVNSAVLCWDWTTGSSCSEGITRDTTSALGPTQDYGYFSEGNCIYGLGHTAIFWAFRADDIREECNGSGTVTPITPCNCGGNLYWGTITFDVTEEQFDVFTIELEDDNGNRVYPAGEGTPPHSLLSDGDTIDLNYIPATDENQRLWVKVDVVAKQGVDPWADGEGSQTFTIEIGRTPRLTD